MSDGYDRGTGDRTQSGRAWQTGASGDQAGVPPRDAAYGHQLPTERFAGQSGGYAQPGYAQPRYAPTTAQGTGTTGATGAQRPGTAPSGLRIQHGQFAAGAVATAMVAAAAGYVVTLIINALFTQYDLGSAWGGAEQEPWHSALVGGVSALVAGAVLWVFLNLVPSPLTFFRWIGGLVILAMVVLPFVSDTHWFGSLLTAALDAFLGILIISLLSAIASRTTDVDRH